jgi:hypothetical protein
VSQELLRQLDTGGWNAFSISPELIIFQAVTGESWLFNVEGRFAAAQHRLVLR